MSSFGELIGALVCRNFTFWDFERAGIQELEFERGPVDVILWGTDGAGVF